MLMIESLLLQDDSPLGISVNYIAVSEGQCFDADIDTPDVLLILEQQLGLRIGGSSTTIGAVTADAQIAELVGVETGAALVWLEDVISDDSGQPWALSQLRLRGDRIAFSARSRRSA